MADAVFHPALVASRADLKPRFRWLAALARSLERAMIAEDTRRTLDELPDNLLRDIGLIRFSETHCAFGNDHAVVHNNDRLVSAGYEYRRVRRL